VHSKFFARAESGALEGGSYCCWRVGGCGDGVERIISGQGLLASCRCTSFSLSHFIPLLFLLQEGYEFCLELGTSNFSTSSCNGIGLRTMRFYKECLESPCTDYFCLKGIRVNFKCKCRQSWLRRISKNEFSGQCFLQV
jgi:hypothetical protein